MAGAVISASIDILVIGFSKKQNRFPRGILNIMPQRSAMGFVRFDDPGMRR
jgi:hypothetical protein